MTSKNAKTFFALTIISLLVGSSGVISNVDAFTPVEKRVELKSNLFVSADNPKFDNTFAGPQVIEVVISDRDIADTDQAKGEPDVTVNGKILRMVQGTDGKWYAYFADRSNAQTADSTVGVESFGLDYGTFCDKTSDVSGPGSNVPDFSDTVGIAIDSKVRGGVQGTNTIDGNLCYPVGDDRTINHVVREAKNPNELVKSPGQINIDANVWPIIQLYDFNPSSNVIVQYNKGGGPQTTTLTFDTVDNLVQMELDQNSYLPNQDVRLTIMDAILNIDPTDEDSWTWASDPVNSAVYYQAFSENGQIDADGVTVNGINAMQDLTAFLPDMMFEDSGVLLVDKNAQGAPNDVLTLDDTGIDILFEDKSGNLRTQTIPHSGFPVTLRETSLNSGTFVNFDSTNDANLDVSSDATRGTTGIITYNDNSLTVLVGDSFCGKSIDQFNVIDGTANNDVLIGTIHDDLIRGFDGDDVIIGQAGNDCLIGGNGDDTIIGNAGNDAITGNQGNDLLFGAAGDDRILGGQNNDVLFGGLGDDFLDGGASFDSCSGGPGTNTETNCEV